MAGDFRSGRKQQKSKMATLDDSPSLFSGQQWTDWANSVLSDLENDLNDSDDADDDTGSDSMKLRKEDMPLFGLCPSRDEFYLVVCEKCNQVVKPQAFQAHLDMRHGGKGGYTVSSSSTKSSQSSNKHSVSSRSHSKSHLSSSKSSSSHSKSSSSSHSKSHSSGGAPTRSSSHSHLSKHHTVSDKLPRSHSPLHTSSGHDTISTSISASVDDELSETLATKASVKEPPQSLDTATKVGAESHTDKVKDSKLKKNHSMPVVKVERMPDTPAMKKQRESSGSARTSLTNGSLRRSRSPPLSMPVLTEDIDVKPSLSLPPDLFAPSSPVLPEEPELAPMPDAEIDNAVSAILEPVSPVPEPETSNYIALATSTSTLTTNTVTMATMTSTTVTNVTNTTSSFTFSSMGRPHFPSGSIRVNFSSTGVLSSISGGSSSSSSNSSGVNVNNNNNNNNVTKSSSCDTNKPPLYSSNGNIENTISDIVKSTINANNSGGFKSLSPLLTSPIKTTSSHTSNVNIAIKSPPSLTLTKSPSLTSNSKLGSKLSPGCSGVFKSLSTGNLPSTTTSSSHQSASSVAALNSEALKKLQLLNKPDKIIPLKDREYDANKHCGVIVAETGKPCTRSLTCKSHALSLRRNVQGRRLPFDELLQEHKDAKEAYMKAKIQSKEATAALKAANSVNKGAHSLPFKSHGLVALSAAKPHAHLNQNLVSKDSKSVTMSVFSPSKPATPQKPGTPSPFRPSLSSMQLGSPPSRDEALSPVAKIEKLSDESEDTTVKDDSYTTYHPRPIAACMFGARYHNLHGNVGCHSFSRRTDKLRAAFMDLLERHLHPPPPKKLCVESNLTKENDALQSSSDPYDFGYLNPSKNLLGQHIIQAPVSVMNTAVLNKVIAKPKSKPSITTNISSATRPKLKDNLAGSKSPGLVTNLQPGLFTSSSAKKRRTSSGSVTQSAINIQSSTLGATLVTAPSIIASVGALTNSAGGSPQFAIAIPNMNLSGTTLSQISANLVASGNLKPGKNNVIKDMGFVVTGLPQDAILNGQYLNITNAQLAGDVSANQVQHVTVEDGVKQSVQSAQHAQVITNNKTVPQAKILNNIDAIRAIQAGKITSLPGNTLLMEGAVLQPVSLTTASANPVVSVGNVAFSQPHHNPVPAAGGPHVRSGSDRPLVSTSSLPNGVVSTPTDKELLLRHQVFQPKTIPQTFVQQRHHGGGGGSGGLPPGSHVLSGAQLHGQNFTFQMPHTPITTQISANTSQVLTNQLTQLQMKNSSIHHKPGTVTMQPVSLTIPFMTQTSAGGVNMGMGGQQTALFITNEEAQKQGLHLHQADPAQPPTAQQPSQNQDTSSIMS